MHKQAFEACGQPGFYDPETDEYYLEPDYQQLLARREQAKSNKIVPALPDSKSAQSTSELKDDDIVDEAVKSNPKKAR